MLVGEQTDAVLVAVEGLEALRPSATTKTLVRCIGIGSLIQVVRKSCGTVEIAQL
jgi:hypothetical protein